MATESTESTESIESTESTESKESKIGDVSSIAESLVDEAPAIQQHAIDKKQESQQREEHANSAPNGPTDRHGASFDSNKHKSDSTGAPVLTTAGNLSLKSGRKAGGAAGAPSQSKIGSSAIGGAPNPEAGNILKARASGKGFASVLITAGQAFGGDEWNPLKQDGFDERANLENCFADYFEATGKQDLPPSMAFAMGIAGYVLPRFSMPNTQEKALGIGTRLAIWWGGRKNKRLQAQLDKEAENKKNEKQES